jgi:hypothetical protein
MLRQEPAAGRAGRGDLHLRVHLLRRLRDRSLRRPVPELRRQLLGPADPAAAMLAKHPASTKRVLKPHPECVAAA